MSFNAEVLKDGRGRVIRIDGSIDGFSTVSYRWGDVAGLLDGTNMYSNRILQLGAIRRGFGRQRIAAGGTAELVLDNADGALDALCGRENVDTQARLRLRVYVALYDPAVPSSLTSKLLGEFTLTQWVKQDREKLTLALGDDVMGAVAQQVALPTFADWQAVGTTANNPFKTAIGLPSALNFYAPIQLAFGEDWVLALPHLIPWESPSANYIGKVIVPVCVTSDTGAGAAYEVDSLRIQYVTVRDTTAFADVPRTRYDSRAGVSADRTLWSTERSPTITKDGKSFKIVYLVVDALLLGDFMFGLDITATTTGAAQPWDDKYGYSGGYPLGAVDWVQNQYKRYAARVFGWWAKGTPLSARTQTTNAIQHPVDVLTDLVTYYSNNTAIGIDTTAAARVKAANAYAACAGVVQGWMQGPKKGDTSFQPPPSLRQTITAICQSSDLDVFINWNGQFSFSTDFWDFRITSASSGWASVSPDGAVQSSGNGDTTAFTPPVIPETWQQGMERWLPSQGERWAPYNRLWLSGGKASPADGVDSVPYQGPWDFAYSDAAISLTSRIIEGTLEQGWRPFRQQAQAPWWWRQINVSARDMVRFRTHIGALQLDLGDYFLSAWTRGPEVGGPYSGSTAFQVEALVYSPTDDMVEVVAVWRNDVTTERQYLLDDETLLVRAKNAAGSIQVKDGNPDVSVFSGSVDFDVMGVRAGDLLVLRDSTQAAEVFTRFRAVRIEAVGATTITLTGDLDFGADAVIADADWSIVGGATTYPSVGDDPTNYPLGGDAYGKVTDSSGNYSNAAQGNRLING